MSSLIKNYTSNISVESSVARIEAKLAAAGASGVMKLYGPDKQVASLVFKMPEGDRQHAIKVPANIDACYQALWRDYCTRVSRPREETKATIRTQAARTAWKLVSDWIDIQVSMIAMKQVKPLEVFLPYVYDGKQTYFEALQANQFKQLPQST